jgi:molybdopterin converting factor small subunit
MKTIKVRYSDTLETQRGINEEAVRTFAGSPEELYKELRSMYSFSVPHTGLLTTVNNESVPMNTPLWEGDIVTFLPIASVN